MLAEVREAMLVWLGVPANPSSAHRAGQAAAVAVERAREQVAALVGGVPEGVVFTSGATEANHLFLRGAFAGRTGVLAVGATEHPCVRGAAAALARRGVEVRTLPVSSDGVARVEVEGADVVSLMAANHETGALQPVSELLGGSAQVHIDATQAAGRVELALGGAAGVTLSSHKLGGPGGVGALVLAHGDAFPALFPGSQERGRRGGTVFTAGVVGFGVACALASAELVKRRAAWEQHRGALEARLATLQARVLSAGVPRVPNTVAFVVPGLRGEEVVVALDLLGICVSAGAACASGSLEASATLLAMGDPEPHGIVRVSFGPTTTEEDVAALGAALTQVVDAHRLAADWLA